MKLKTARPDINLKNSDTIAILLSQEDIKNIKNNKSLDQSSYIAGIDLSYFKGSCGEIIFFSSTDKANVILCGLGEEREINSELLRNCAASITSFCRDKSILSINIHIPAHGPVDAADVISAIAEGICLSNYSFDKYKSRSGDDTKELLKNATFITGVKFPTGRLKEIETICGNTLLCRSLINDTSDSANATAISGIAQKLTKLPGVTCRVFGKKELSEMGMGLLLAVNRGSSTPPQLVVLKYTGDPGNKKYCAIVGKGITFDSGGLNLKPTGHIEEMRSDMGGAAAALYTLKTAAELKLKKNIYAVMPLTDNMVSSTSYRPGDVFKAYSGKTVEIGNTDAEGRLVLADALAYTEKQLKPACIIDLATLTGACLVALGEITAAYLTTDEKLGTVIKDAGNTSGDRVWELPLFKEYGDNLKSDIADIRNVAHDRYAGTILGGMFLKNFVEKTPWVHIDIAGTSWYSKPRGYRPKAATGFGVRLLIEALKNWKG